MAKKKYIVKNSGISPKGIDREHIKLDAVIEMEEKHAKGYCERGFLLFVGDAPKSKDPEKEKLAKRVAELEVDNKTLSDKIAELEAK